MEVMEKQKFIFGSLFLLANKLQVIGDQYLGQDDITTKQWFLTAMISQFRDKPPTLSQVADLIGSSRQNVKQLALKLEEKDFLRLERDEEDARATRLRLTEKCQSFWDQREAQDNEFVAKLFEDFSEEEIDIMGAGMNKLLQRIGKLGK